jgi:hypothetical protein
VKIIEEICGSIKENICKNGVNATKIQEKDIR